MMKKKVFSNSKPFYTIGQLARALGIKISKIRYYERCKIIQEPPRNSSGHRRYSFEDKQKLEFIQRAQGLGFRLMEIQELLELRVDRYSNCENVRQRISKKSEEIKKKIQELQSIDQALERLSLSCSDKGPTGSCPIIEELSKSQATRRT